MGTLVDAIDTVTSAQFWANVTDVGPELSRHWSYHQTRKPQSTTGHQSEKRVQRDMAKKGLNKLSASVRLAITPSLVQCYVNAGPAAEAVARH